MGWKAVNVCVFVLCECGGGWGDYIRESHTQLHSPGDSCQPVILPCTPLPARSLPLLLTAEIGQPHIMQGQWGASTCNPPQPPSTLSLCSPPPCYLYPFCKREQAMAPHGHSEAGCGATGTASHNIPTSQPQQPFARPRLNWADSSVSYGMCTLTRQTHTKGLKYAQLCEN